MITVSAPALGFDLTGGVSAGGVLAGTKPRLAVSPHAGISWPMESGFLLAVHDICSVMPATNRHGAGVHNQSSVALGYSSEKIALTVGPSLAIYSMPACDQTACGRVVGLAPGAVAQASYYFTGPLGVSVTGTAEWIGGSSGILPGGAAATIVAGLVLRWRSK